jgi:YbbR domain-containing protein
VLHWLGQNFRIFLLAFGLAIVVWVSAVSAADPNVTQVYPHAVPLEIVGQDPGLIMLGDTPKDVQVTLKAPQSVWDKLVSDPSLIRAVLDLSTLSAGEHTASIQMQIAERPVQIITTSPSTVTFKLEPLATRTMPVRTVVNGEPAVGYKMGDPITNPGSVVISGPKPLVDQANEVRTAVNANNAREAIDSVVPVVVLGADSRPISGLSLNPDAVHVTVPVAQQGGYRDLAVKVDVTGQVASGYHLTSISVYPPVVTVFAADPTVVNALPGYAETSPLDLQGAKDNIETRLALILPAGVSVVGDSSVLVQAGISAIQSSITLRDQNVEIIGLDPGLLAQVSPKSVDIILSGPLPVLEGLRASDVHVVLDLTGLAAGTHQLTPGVNLPSGDITVESIIPATLEVVLAPLAATPTP